MKTSNLLAPKHIHSALLLVKMKAKPLLRSKASLPSTLMPSQNSDSYDYLLSVSSTFLYQLAHTSFSILYTLDFPFKKQTKTPTFIFSYYTLFLSLLVVFNSLNFVYVSTHDKLAYPVLCVCPTLGSHQ